MTSSLTLTSMLPLTLTLNRPEFDSEERFQISERTLWSQVATAAGGSRKTAGAQDSLQLKLSYRQTWISHFHCAFKRTCLVIYPGVKTIMYYPSNLWCNRTIMWQALAPDLQYMRNSRVGRTLFLEQSAFECTVYSVWGPVEWVGDQLTGWGESSQKQNLKRNVLSFLIFFYLSDRYWDIC